MLQRLMLGGKYDQTTQLGTDVLVRDPERMVQTLEGWQIMIQAQKVERPRLASEPFAELTNNVVDFPIPDASSKALATLKAQMALAGHSVYDGGNDDFIVVKADWGMSRHCPDWSALQRFARVLGAAHG